jgi:HD-GYP domain-containing protein (c-di-GMP phosphodiesterase class II)
LAHLTRARAAVEASGVLQTPTRKRPQATTTQEKRRNQPHSTQAVGEPPAAGAELDLLGDDRLKSYLPAVFGATALVAVLPTVVVWYLRESGTVSSYLLGAAIGVVLSLSLAQAGRLAWQKGKHSKQLLFSELLLWGYLERRYRERRLRNARALLGHTNDAQQRIEGGLSQERQVKLLEQMAATLDSRDPCTHGHSRRVARFAWTIASRMGLPREEVDRIRTAAAVHDLGKIETPNSILRKPGKLTDEEYEIMKRHASDGARMVEVLNDVELTAMVRHHHERLDGSGYPDKLRGEDIPLGARIIAVADTFDSITADRPYRAARPHKEALDILTKEAGTKLDGHVVSVFQRHYAGRRRLAFFSSLSTLPERVLEQLASAGGGVATAAKAVAVAALLGNVAAGTAKIAATPASQVSKSSGGQATTASGVAPSGASSSSSGAQGQVQGGIGRSGGRRNNTRGARRAVGTKLGASGAIAAGTTGGGSQPAGSGSANANANAGAGGGQGSGSSETTSSSGQESKPTAGTEAGKEQGSKTTTSGSPPAPSTGAATGSGSSGSGNGKSNGGGAVGGVVETVKETKGKVEETVKETVKGTVEETKKTVETVKGTVEETKGKVEETTKGVVEETKKKLKEIIKLAQPRLAG